jgi:hypothetical protein
MGWRDLVLDRITDDQSGGGYTSNDFLGRSNTRRKRMPGVSDPISDLGPLGDANAFEGRIQEEPIESQTQPWRPSSNRRTMSGFDIPEQGPAMTEYLKHIENVPGDNGENYSPSIWRRMLAGLSGGAAGATGGALQGIKAAQYINEIPYRRAVEDYERKGQSLESAAKIEEASQRNRTAYQKGIWDQEEADKDREVKWANSEINRLKAEQAAKRIALEAEAKRATNQTAVDRLNAQIVDNDRKYDTELAKLELMKQNVGINQQRANTGQYAAESGRISANAAAQNATTNTGRGKAYEGYIGRLGQPKPMSPASIGITRRIIEEELKNEFGAQILDKQGEVKPEYRAEFERQIQRRLRERVGNTAPDDNPYEIIP